MSEREEAPAGTGASNSGDRGGDNEGMGASALDHGSPELGRRVLGDSPADRCGVDDAGLGSLALLIDAYRADTLGLVEVLDLSASLGYSAPDVGRTLAWAGVTQPEMVDATRAAQVDRAGLLRGFLHAGPAPRYEPWHTVPALGRSPAVRISGDLRVTSSRTWRELTRLNDSDTPFLYRFGNRLAWVTDDDGLPRVQLLRDDALKHLLSRVLNFTSRRGQRVVSTHPPASVIRDLQVDPSPPVPILQAVSSVPIVTPKGSLHLRRGYDAESRTLYLPPDGLVLPPLMTDPPSVDIERARALLVDDLLGDFPFVGDGDRAHVVAAVLLPFLRPVIDAPTPLHLIHKPAPGTGATLLTQVIGAVVAGQAINVMTEPRDEDEWRKHITASLLRGPQVILIDNLSKRLDSPALSAALTTRVWEDRILGRSEMVDLPVRCLWLATGNNPGLSNEMARRTVPIRLDANIERPWLRDGFRHPDLLAWAIGHRDDLVWAALTLISAWISKGRPLATARLGMYEEWAQVIGGVLAVSEISGLLSNLDDLYAAADLETMEWEAFFTAWYDRHGEAAVKVKDVFGLAQDSLDLSGTSEQGRKTGLGKALSDRRERIIGGLQLSQAGLHQGAVRWRLTRVGVDPAESQDSW